MGASTTYSTDVDSLDRLQERLSEKRGALMEAEHRLRVMRIQIDATQREIAEMEGFGLGGLLSRVKGDRESRLRESRSAASEMQMKYQAEARTLKSISAEIATIERQIVSTAGRSPADRAKASRSLRAPASMGPKPQNPPLDSASESSTPVVAATSATADPRAALARAMEAGEAARRDLLQEMETVSTLGRCNIAAPRGVLGMMMNRTRAGTADECAGRIRKSIERFLNRRAEALGGAESLDEDEANLLAAVTRAGRELNGSALQSDELVNQIQVLTMYVEKRHREATGEAV